MGSLSLVLLAVEEPRARRFTEKYEAGRHNVLRPSSARWDALMVGMLVCVYCVRIPKVTAPHARDERCDNVMLGDEASVDF